MSVRVSNFVTVALLFLKYCNSISENGPLSKSITANFTPKLRVSLTCSTLYFVAAPKTAPMTM